MKKYTLWLLALSVSLMSFQCDDDEDPGVDRFVPGALTATIDGVNKDFSKSQRASTSEFVTGDSTFEGFIISGMASTDDGEITIDLVPFTGEGTYTLSNQVEGNVAYSSARYDRYPPGGGLVTSFGTSEEFPGTVTITSYDGNEIKGTFSFTGGNFDSDETITVTNGSINLVVQQ